MVLIVTLMSCTSHPVITPEPVKPGETYRGVVFSAENILPQFVYRKGMGDRSDIGLRIGMLPIFGSGIDMTFVLRDEGSRLHSVNFAGTYAEQSSFEATYYNVKKNARKKRIRKEGKTFIQTDTTSSNYRYLGLRYANYLKGFWGEPKHLFGFLYGINFKKNWGVELGYFHDFSGEPALPDFGIDPKYAPLGGVSIRLWFGKVLAE
jgi:hypothetical protein